MLLHLYGQGKAPRLILDSPGGNIMDADKLALLIRKAGIPVTVLAGRMCASACFLMFAASPERSASPLALIGVHSASMFGDENLLTLDLTTIMAREAAEFGVPADVIGRMVTTKPSEMAWLTPKELKEMDVHFLEASTDVAPSQQVPAIAQTDDPSRPQPQLVPAPLPSPTSIIPPNSAGAPEGLNYQPADFAGVGSPAPRVDEDGSSTHHPIVRAPVHGPRPPDYSPVGSSQVLALLYHPGS